VRPPARRGRRPGAAAGLVWWIVRYYTICPGGIIRTATYDVDAPFMQLERHDWDIHAV
jgi:hypothetical protein